MKTPGSEEAKKEGCTCPVMDNNNGLGILLDGSTQFWISDGCPVHDPDKTKYEGLDPRDL